MWPDYPPAPETPAAGPVALEPAGVHEHPPGAGDVVGDRAEAAVDLRLVEQPVEGEEPSDSSPIS